MNKFLVSISEHAKYEEMGLSFPYPDIWDLLPVAILCGISILFTVLWLLAVWEYAWLRDRQRRENNEGHGNDPRPSRKDETVDC
ncbi:MAG: hypothetical protein ACYSWP_20020 [Planctomycetota bacterium]|jgi:hypothetical protein